TLSWNDSVEWRGAKGCGGGSSGKEVCGTFEVFSGIHGRGLRRSGAMLESLWAKGFGVVGIVQFDKSIILFDPQAHTKAGMSGSWDRGSEEIDKFCKEHKCNVICKQLELRDLSQPFPHRPW
ncbi:hypothetical protein F5051DRAFT_479904, partial [Lentinula edodes]